MSLKKLVSGSYVTTTDATISAATPTLVDGVFTWANYTITGKVGSYKIVATYTDTVPDPAVDYTATSDAITVTNAAFYQLAVTGQPDGDAVNRTAECAIEVTAQDRDEAQAELGMVEGFDICFEMSGSAVALRSAIASMAHGGRIAQLGIPTGDVSLDLNEIVFKMLTLRGIYGREMYETWYKMTVMIQSGLDITPVITHRFHYPEYEKGFEVMRSGNSGKVVLNWVEDNDQIPMTKPD